MAEKNEEEITVTIDDALSKLAKSVVLDEDGGEEKSPYDVPFVKSYEDEELATELADATDFMKALAENQDGNTEILAKAITGVMEATASLADVVKSQGEALAEIRTILTEMGSTPRPRKGVLTEAELRSGVMQKGSPTDAELQGGFPVSVTKSDMLKALTDAVHEGKAEVRDVTMLEATSDGGPFTVGVDVAQAVDKMSSGGRKVIESLVSRARQ